MNQYINKHKVWLLLKHEAEIHELPQTKEAYERAARIIDAMPADFIMSVDLKEDSIKNDYR